MSDERQLESLQQRIGEAIAQLATGDVEKDPVVAACRRAALAVTYPGKPARRIEECGGAKWVRPGPI